MGSKMQALFAADDGVWLRLTGIGLRYVYPSLRFRPSNPLVGHGEIQENTFLEKIKKGNIVGGAAQHLPGSNQRSQFSGYFSSSCDFLQPPVILSGYIRVTRGDSAVQDRTQFDRSV